MPGTNSTTGSGAPRPPVTETQIPPPQIPPQAPRAPTGATAASAGTGPAPATTAPSTAPSPSMAGTGGSPPVTQRARTASQPKATPIPAPVVPLVQETPVPAPQIPGFSTSSTSGPAGSPPKETKVVPPVPPMSSTKTSRPIKTPVGPSKAAAKIQSSTPDRKQQQRSWSPPRPPISPVLAPADMPAHLRPTATGSGTFYKSDFAAGRPQFRYTQEARESAASIAHSELHEQVAAAARAVTAPNNAASAGANANAQLAPGPTPIDLKSNPDMLALGSTLSILQIQRKKALDDIRKLQIARDAALANPAAFLEQLRNMGTPASGSGPAPSSSSRPRQTETPLTNVSDKGGDVDMSGDTATNTPNREVRGNSVSSSSSDESAAAPPGGPSTVPVVDLKNLPKPQNIVRMPHINWSKYGIVGESLDKVHAEQVRRPPSGQPAVASVVPGDTQDDAGGSRVNFGEVNFGGSGTRAIYTYNGFESAAEAAENEPLAPIYRGIAAPYDPQLDVIGADQPAAGHRSSTGSTPGEGGPQLAFGASFSSAVTGTGSGSNTGSAGRESSVASNAASQPFQFTGASPAEAPADNGPPAASTRRKRSGKSANVRQ